MSGVFDWLDNVTTQVGTIAGKAVDVAGKIATDTAAIKAANTQNDQTPVKATAVLQGTAAGGLPTWVWIVGGLVVVGGAVLLLRKR
jgi:hypothetical protein